MGFLTFFSTTKSKQGSPDMGPSLDAIISIEKKRDAVKAALDDAQEALQKAYAKQISEGGDDPDTGPVKEAQTRLEAVETLLRSAKGEAIGLLSAGVAAQRELLSELEEKIAGTRAAIDRRRVETLAKFVKAHDLQIQWPTKHTAGSIAVPSLALGSAEVLELANNVSASPQPDKQAAELEKLLADRQRLNMIVGSQPDIAMESLLAERRRQR